jgi:hypothetical protein
MLEELDGAATDAIVFAVARGWVIVEAGRCRPASDGIALAQNSATLRHGPRNA